MDEYRKVVEQINELNLSLQKRVKRCHYLRRRGDLLNKINPEQAEAYYVRINAHKPKLCDLIEAIERLEDELRRMPRQWIV